MNDIDLLEDVAPASNELGAVADMALIWLKGWAILKMRSINLKRH